MHVIATKDSLTLNDLRQIIETSSKNLRNSKISFFFLFKWSCAIAISIPIKFCYLPDGGRARPSLIQHLLAHKPSQGHRVLMTSCEDAPNMWAMSVPNNFDPLSSDEANT